MIDDEEDREMPFDDVAEAPTRDVMDDAVAAVRSTGDDHGSPKRKKNHPLPT